MIIKDIAKQGISEIGNIVPLKKNNIISIKINKTIEIVVVPNLGPKNSHQDNVGIVIEEKNILRILSKRYKDVSITEINSEKDLEALVINTGGGNSEHRLHDAMALRRATLGNKVPYCTNMSTAQACLMGIRSLKTKEITVTSLQDI